MSAPDRPYWPVGLGSSDPAQPSPALVHVFMLPPLPLDIAAHLEWLRRNIAPTQDRFVSCDGEPLLGCQLGKLWWRDGTGGATVVGSGAGVYAVSRSDGRTVPVAAILLREVGEWSEARVEVYEPAALPYFATVFDAIAAAFPAQARPVAAARAALAEHVAATWPWVSWPSPAPAPAGPAVPGEPVAPPAAPARRAKPTSPAARLPEPAKDSHFDAWFEWREAKLQAGYKVTLETIALKMGYSHGYVKQLHALWRAGRSLDF